MTNQAAVQSSGSEEPADETKTADRGNRDRGKRRHRPGPGGPGRGGAQPSLDLDEIRQVVELIDSHGFTEFEVEREGYRLHLRRELTPQVVHSAPPPPQPARTAVAESASPAPAAEPAKPVATPAAVAPRHVITSPIVGTFYRSPSPESASFVNIGSRVTAETIVCIVEAMKLMNEIQAETTGEIVEIFVENGQPVEFGQPLFAVGD
jgi:acetyl-CoA carboxylase biotin carboxyl carrier protein